MLLPAWPAASAGQGKVDARYAVTLAGLPIGKGAWVVDISENQFTAAASGTTSGVLRVFTSGAGSGASRGHVHGGNLIPSSFASSITTGQIKEETRIVLNGGTVTEYTVEPPWPPHPDRIPITEAHRRGVSDPMTASLIRVPGSGDPVSPEACNKTASIFDGRMRYDLQLAYKRIENVKLEKGYQGPVVVCAIYFLPVAGFIPDRAAINHLIAERDMEVWLAPVAGTHVVIPYRISIPTPLGLGVMEATQFVTTRHAAGPTPTSAKVRSAPGGRD